MSEVDIKKQLNRLSRQMGRRLSPDAIGILALERLTAFQVVIGNIEAAEHCARTLLQMQMAKPGAVKELEQRIPTTQDLT